MKNPNSNRLNGEIRVAVVGDSDSGKSCLINTYASDPTYFTSKGFFKSEDAPVITHYNDQV